MEEYFRKKNEKKRKHNESKYNTLKSEMEENCKSEKSNDIKEKTCNIMKDENDEINLKENNEIIKNEEKKTNDENEDNIKEKNIKNEEVEEEGKNKILKDDNLNEMENKKRDDNTNNDSLFTEKEQELLEIWRTKRNDKIMHKNIKSFYDEEFMKRKNLKEEYNSHYKRLKDEHEFFKSDNPYLNCLNDKINDCINNKEKSSIFNDNINSSVDGMILENNENQYDSDNSNFSDNYYEHKEINFQQIYDYIYKDSNPYANNIKFKNDNLYLALIWIKEKLSIFTKSTLPNVRQCVLDTTSLIAYQKPYKQKRVRMFFSKNRNLLTFNAVNEGILGICLKVPIHSPLEIIVKHLIVCRNLLREKKGNIGIKYDCCYVCQPYKKYLIKIKRLKKKRRYFQEIPLEDEKPKLNGRFGGEFKFPMFP